MNYFELMYLKYAANTGVYAMNRNEAMGTNAVVLICIFLFVRYTYLFTAQLVDFMLS